MIGRRAAVLALAAGVACGVPAGLPYAADPPVRILLTAKRTAVPQGMPLEFETRLTNQSPGAVAVAVTFKVMRSGAPESAVPFGLDVVVVPPQQTEAVKRSVTPAQWFGERGRFEVAATMYLTAEDFETAGTPAPALAFTVVRAPLTVPRFQDVTASSGLATTTPDFTCGLWAAGAAWGDVDGDRDLDLYVPRFEGPAHLWINRGGGRFVDEAAARGVDNGGANGIGAVFADYDNDGDQDLHVANAGVDRLYRNNGSGTFVDVAAQAGIAAPTASSSASWGDYDRDGYLDLYVVSHSRCDPDHADLATGGYLDWLTYLPDRLYHNERNGTFTDQTALLEHDPSRREDGSTIGAGFQAAWFDYDGDNDVDLYLANDFIGRSPDRNHLWRNDGRGADGRWQFTDVSVASGTAYDMNSMGLAIGDYDRDLDLDVAISNIEANKLLRNNRDGTFTDVAAYARVGRAIQRADVPSITWGTAFFDLNLDGWEDLYFAEGPTDIRRGNWENQLFVNDTKGRFLDLSVPSGAADAGFSRGVAFADYDRDGRVDLYVVNQTGTPRLYRNVTAKGGHHWLEVDLVGTASNRDACGAQLVLTAARKSMMRQVFCGSTSLASGSDATAHFGLGRATRVSRLVVRWPSGRRQVLRNLKVDRLMTVREPRR
jgi:hypothetical protein